MQSYEAGRQDDQAAGPPAERMQLVAQQAAALGCLFTSAQWTADGSTILASTSDKRICTYILPKDLLDRRGSPLRLDAQATIGLAEPTQVVGPAPYFSLADTASQVLLVGCRDHPLQLLHAFPARAPLQTYRLVRQQTEQHLWPASLLWPWPGSHFVCGSADRLDYFDAARDTPLRTLHTIPSRRHVLKGGGVGFKGTVSALAAPQSCPSLVAAGTRTRAIGLYDLARCHSAVASWSLDGPGHGIVQLLWSPCARYLVVNERRASSLVVYDMRASKLLARLSGRASTSQQRLVCDVYQGLESPGFEVWAGDELGRVCIWDRVGCSDASPEPSWSWPAHHAPVSSTALHPCGSVLATCSGAWRHTPDPALDGFGGPVARPHAISTEPLPESCLNIWSLATLD
ncbi:hypothetical protein CDD81_4649 [Ophiocordyceps australis]|uniref:Anaphase-promoting complex subunit 4 WD40 domain-containing protein n=1 Tax=Ophiocordyceps australis TaxID=1399860 RepID=A0A2C5XJ22_9HYPO|nr:hypothetical protein CDD81_4649 [Ophiocordyceps australis]